MSRPSDTSWAKVERTAPGPLERKFLQAAIVLEELESELRAYRRAKEAGCFLGPMFSKGERDAVDAALRWLKKNRLGKPIGAFEELGARCLPATLPMIPIKRSAIEDALQEQGLASEHVSITFETWEL